MEMRATTGRAGAPMGIESSIDMNTRGGKIEVGRRVAFMLSQAAKAVDAESAPEVRKDVVMPHPRPKPAWFNEGPLEPLPVYTQPPQPTAEEIAQRDADAHINRASGALGRTSRPTVRTHR